MLFAFYSRRQAKGPEKSFSKKGMFFFRRGKTVWTDRRPPLRAVSVVPGELKGTDGTQPEQRIVFAEPEKEKNFLGKQIPA